MPLLSSFSAGTTSRFNEGESTSDGNFVEDICDNGTEYCSITIVGSGILLIVLFIGCMFGIRTYFKLKKFKKETDEDWTAEENARSDNANIQSQAMEINQLMKEKAELHEAKEKLARETNCVKQQLDRERHDWERETNYLKEELRQLASQDEKLKEKADAETSRYNELLEIRIRQDPSFADINDQLRPQKVLVNFKALCDSQRLDMLDRLEDLGTTTPDYLSQLPFDIAQHCHDWASKLVQACDDRVIVSILEVAGQQRDSGFFEADGECLGDLNKIQLKESTRLEIRQELKFHSHKGAEKGLESVVVGVMQEFNLPEEDGMTAFVQECARLTWYMVLQAVPIRLLGASAGQPLDPNLFNLYADCTRAKKGPVTFTMWPAVVTGQKGSSDFTILQKGMVFTAAN